MYLKEIGSTNDYAWNLLSNSNPNENIVIIAEDQTNGKGQYDRIWATEPGKNITMTAMMQPNELWLKNAFHLNIIVSVAIIKAIKTITGIITKIKWPNDIYYEDDKLVGILIKNKVTQNLITHTIMGMGINVNQTNFDPNIKNPTSLKIILGEDIDQVKLASEILNNLHEGTYELATYGIEGLHEYYQSNLYAARQWRSYKVNGIEKLLSIRKVDPSGIIHLISKTGEKISLSSGLEYLL